MKVAFLISMMWLLSAIGYAQELSLLDSGYAYYEVAEYKKAIEVFEQAVIETPENPELYYLMGVCRSLSGDNYHAIRDYEKAIELSPDYAEAYYEKGYASYLMGELKKAMSAFDKAIELRPNYAEAYVNRGSLKCMDGDSEGAEKDWDKAAELGAALPVRDCN